MASNIVQFDGIQPNRPLVVSIPAEQVQALVQAIVDLSAEGEIRTTEDGRYSVFDVIENVGAKGSPHQVWKRLIAEHSGTLTNCDSVKLPRSDGKRANLPTPVTDLAGCLEIIWLLPGDVSRKFRRIGAQVSATVIEQASNPQPELDIFDVMIRSIQIAKQNQEDIKALQEENRQLQSQLIQALELASSAKQLTEVVALETEANTVELGRFRNGHGFYFTIAAWCNKYGYRIDFGTMQLLGRKASAMCRSRGIQPVPINDPRFGQVNSYPDTLLMEMDWSQFQ